MLTKVADSRCGGKVVASAVLVVTPQIANVAMSQIFMTILRLNPANGEGSSLVPALVMTSA